MGIIIILGIIVGIILFFKALDSGDGWSASSWQDEDKWVPGKHLMSYQDRESSKGETTIHVKISKDD